MNIDLYLLKLTASLDNGSIQDMSYSHVVIGNVFPYKEFARTSLRTIM